MSSPLISFPTDKLVQLGLKSPNSINYQLSPEELIQDVLRTGGGVLSNTGALVVSTGEFTGRSPKDKFIVNEPSTSASINWNEFNQPIDEQYYAAIYRKVHDYLNRRDELWIRDAFVCADERFRVKIRLVNELPASDLFASNMFIRPTETELQHFKPEWQILAAPNLRLDPQISGTRQSNATIINFRSKTIIVAGSGYTGELKKGIFTIMNYLLPKQGVLSMHCASNIGSEGDTAVFFGLSGTGKTTLSADPDRMLIGDDEHGWTDTGIFNLEGGCYAKVINLNEQHEPEIYRAIKPGSMVENIRFYPGSNVINFCDGSITENTRVSYPIDFITHAVSPSVGSIPDNVFFLTCDASGVLPPISKLSPAQAMYHFISGYTAKIAGTESGITEPKPTFSACFGAPFIPLHPSRYASMLGNRIRKHQVSIWLVNTGWTGGGYGTGNRINLQYTRKLIAAALERKLDDISYGRNEIFGLAFPLSCPGVPDLLLDAKASWKNEEAYDMAARKLATLFKSNFDKYAAGVEPEVFQAGPL